MEAHFESGPWLKWLNSCRVYDHLAEHFIILLVPGKDVPDGIAREVNSAAQSKTQGTSEQHGWELADTRHFDSEREAFCRIVAPTGARLTVSNVWGAR